MTLKTQTASTYHICENNAHKEVSLIRRVTMVGFWINAFLVVLKLFFGYWGHSDALVADGYHSLSDFATDLLVIVFVGIAYKRADHDHPYGHGKYETVAAVLIAVVLMMVAVGIGWQGVESIVRSLHGEILPQPDIWTLVVAFASILMKEFCYRYTMRYAVRLGSSALKANAWHHRSDAISSVATLVGVSMAIIFGEHWRIMDPVASVMIAVFIAISAWNIAKPAVNELLEISVPQKEREEIMEAIRSVSGVRKVHNLRSRNNGHSTIIDVNIHVDPDITVSAGHIIATDVEQELKRRFTRDMIIYVHVEPDD